MINDTRSHATRPDANVIDVVDVSVYSNHGSCTSQFTFTRRFPELRIYVGVVTTVCPPVAVTVLHK
jgi:hypothetical protein